MNQKRKNIPPPRKTNTFTKSKTSRSAVLATKPPNHPTTQHQTQHPNHPTPDPRPITPTPDPSLHPNAGRGDRRRGGGTSYHRWEEGVQLPTGTGVGGEPLPKERKWRTPNRRGWSVNRRNDRKVQPNLRHSPPLSQKPQSRSSSSAWKRGV